MYRYTADTYSIASLVCVIAVVCILYYSPYKTQFKLWHAQFQKKLLVFLEQIVLLFTSNTDIIILSWRNSSVVF